MLSFWEPVTKNDQNWWSDCVLPRLRPHVRHRWCLVPDVSLTRAIDKLKASIASQQDIEGSGQAN